MSKPSMSPDEHPLTGLRVLATRPAHQSAELLARLHAAGATADNFPTIEIIETPCDDVLLRCIAAYDVAIFISGNAVTYGLKALQEAGVALTELPPTLAVGRSTATRLKAAGVADVRHPTQPSSQSLLALPIIQALAAPSKALIFRGRGGKEVLAGGLRTRGVAVDYAEVYTRRKPQDLQLSFTDPPPDLILVTSRDGLQNLYAMTAAASRAQLLKTQLVIGSASMLDVHRELGFQHPPLIATSPLDDDMVAAVLARCGR